ncbi:MAG: sugar transporter [Hymenobacter sp.]|nr:MAG: sugar transporter [Hymenobacter sp.]
MNKKNFTTIKFLILSAFLAASACGPSRSITYFNNLQNTGNTKEEIKNRADPKIQPDDLLSITVSSLNPEANLLFNSGVIQAPNGTTGAAPITSKLNEGYLVDKNGTINYPVLGYIKLADLTREQAVEKMTVEIKRQIKDPIVNVRFLNFRITVIGEVNKPSSFTIPTERVNIMEALALAGDMTTFGKRENVLIIREADGVRTTTRVDLTNKEVLASPYYYLQQNDILYVEPAKIKRLQGGSGTFYVGLASAAVSILSLFIIFLRR